MLTWALTTLHVFICLFLIIVVLLQKGKGQDFASTFGGGGTQTAFGARSGATILHRLTTVAAVLFMVTSLTLTIVRSQPGQGSVLDDEAPVETTVPATPVLPALPPPAAGEGATVPDDPAVPQDAEPGAGAPAAPEAEQEE